VQYREISILKGGPVPCSVHHAPEVFVGHGHRVPKTGQAWDVVRHPPGRTSFIVFMLRSVTPLGSAQEVQMVTPKRVTQRRKHHPARQSTPEGVAQHMPFYTDDKARPCFVGVCLRGRLGVSLACVMRRYKCGRTG